MNVLPIAAVNKGRIARPSHAATSSTGTRSRIFSFNEFAGTVGLKEPRQSAAGTDLSKENLASIPPLASACGAIL